jgi:uncharacterized protein
MSAPRLVIAGASGFLGRAVALWFVERGWQVIALSRKPVDLPGARAVRWDGRHLGAWVSELNGAEALLNLAGRSVNCRYDARHRAEILHSRTESTRLLGEALERCVQPPRHWLNASTATIYRHSEDRPMDEDTGELGTGFSVEVARAWEAAFFAARTPATRRTALRTSLVLGEGENSVYPTLRRLARLGLGGRQGDGRQRVSWIHLEDFCRAVEHLLAHPLDGVVNLTAPDPVPNARFMALLRESLGLPLGLSAPRPLLAVGAWLLRTETELILKSRWVWPARLLEAGFTFRHPTARDALAALAAPRQGAEESRRPRSRPAFAPTPLLRADRS